MDLTITEEQEFAECESAIEEGIKHFVKTGNALLRIRNGKLYRKLYPTFEEYCKGKWGISTSQGYHLMASADVVNSLDSPTLLPDKSSHAFKLAILKDDELRKEAWQEVVTTVQDPLEITGELVEAVARKHHVLHNGDPELARKIRLMEITPDKAYRLQDMINKMPPYIKESIKKHGLEGGCVDPATIVAIRTLEYQFKQEGLDIWASGGLDDGRQIIPLHLITVRDVEAYKRKLAYEATQTRKIEAGEKQNLIFTKPTSFIADGFDIAEMLETNVDKSVVGFLFPDNQLTPSQLAKYLETNGYQILFVAAYTNNPLIDFNGRKQPISSVNGVKPDSIMKMIKEIVPNS